MSEHGAVTTEDLAATEDRAQEDMARDDAAQEDLAQEPEYRSEEPGTGEIPEQAKPEATRRPDEQRAPLFDSDDTDRFRENWRELQTDFVDDPQHAVQQADELVAEVMQTLAATFADHKRTLEEQWSRGGEVQTEDLRLALQQYRVFFQQLLAV